MKNPFSWLGRKRDIQPAEPAEPVPTLADIIERYTEKQAAKTREFLGAELSHMEAKRDGITNSYAQHMSGLLDSEYAVRQDIERRKHEELKPIEEEIRRLKALIQAHPFDQKYARLKMECLRLLKTQDGLPVPAFSIFSISEPGCSIVVSARWDRGNRRPGREHCEVKPNDFWQEFAPAHEALSARAVAACRRKGDCKSIAVYDALEGIVPAGFRKTIVEARQEFEQLYFVAEGRWRQKCNVYDTELAKGSREMLLIGMRKCNGSSIYWLITKLRTQTTEEYLREARSK